MNREIRFRAWDQERQAMVDGTDIEEFTEEVDEESYTVDCPRYTTGLSYGNLFVAYTNKRGDWNECEVMQFTGLHDKNGKEIYEGDVLKTSWQHDGCTNFDYEITGVVTFDEVTAQFIVENKAKDRWCPFYSFEREEYFPDESEVIGNIYENPELLPR